MKYKNTLRAKFIKRPNRFVAYCMIGNEEEKVYVPNTGRCKELFREGVDVVLSKANDNSKRKTKYSLVSVYKGERLINIDSQAPNAIVEEGLREGAIFEEYNFVNILREKKYKKSRFDIYYERTEHEEIIEGFIEVKGVTLESNNRCLFPDAPTERGVKHILELIDASKNGYEANILFLIQMSNVENFSPNYEMHKEFAEVLAMADKKGVKIHAFSCNVEEEQVRVSSPVEICDLSVFLKGDNEEELLKDTIKEKKC